MLYFNCGMPVVMKGGNMTGSLVEKTLKSGNTYYYIKLSYKDTETGLWCQKLLSTGLESNGNKRKATAMIQPYIERYSYLEAPPKDLALNVDANVTVCDYVKEWLDEVKLNDIESTTYVSYVYRAKHILNYFETTNPRLADITPRMLDKFFKYLRLKGKTNQKTHEKEALSVRSVRSVKSILHSIFEQASVDGIITINPVKSVSVKGKKNSDYSEDMLFLTETECQELLSFLNSSDNPEFNFLLPIAFLGIYYGLRRSEILGLKWSAIDCERKLIHIRHTIVRIKDIEARDSTKTKSSHRDLALFQTAEKCLQHVKEKQNEEKEYWGNTYKNKEGYIFTKEDGSMYDPNYISKVFSKATTAFGRPEITLHKLRHTCASLLIDKGWDVKRVQYWLGHSDIQTTLNIYAHYNTAKINSSANDLEAIASECIKFF